MLASKLRGYIDGCQFLYCMLCPPSPMTAKHTTRQQCDRRLHSPKCSPSFAGLILSQDLAKIPFLDLGCRSVKMHRISPIV